MSNLVNLNEIKSFLKIKTANTEEDGRLSNIATQVSTMVSSYCGRTFAANNYTEYFNGGISSVFIENPPINRVDEVAHFDGIDYKLLGCPGTSGQPIAVEGQSHNVNRVGDPKFKTRIKKFNRSSLRLDGSSYLTINESEDWDFGVDSFTIELFARFDDTSTGSQTLISSGSSGDNWSLGLDFDSLGFNFSASSSSVQTISVNEGSSSYSDNQFYHLAMVKDENTINLYKNGTSVANLTTSNSIPQYSEGLVIGANYDYSNKTVGYLDDLRISHTARYSSNFTAPTYPTLIDEDTKLMLRFDGPNNTNTIEDVSRRVNEFSFFPTTGEVSFDTGAGAGTPRLGFFNPKQFYNYPRGIRVTYNGGYPTIPEDLKLAVLEMVKVVYKGDSGTASTRFQGESRDSHKLSVDEFPPQVRRILNLYRLIT
jgi:hypothetical protein